MGSAKRTRRAERLHAADVEDFRRSRETPREIAQDIFFRGSGLLACQIARIPSFTLARCFDVRRGGTGAPSPIEPSPDRLRLFRAEGTAPGSRLVVGYEELAVPEGTLESFLTRLARVQIPMLAEQSTYGVADGSRLEVAVSNRLALLRVTWVEDDAPAALAELEQIAKEMLSTFENLPAAGPTS